MSFAAPIAGVPNKDSRKSPGSGNGLLEDDTNSDMDISMEEPSGSTLKQDHSNNLDKLSSIMSLIREYVRYYVALVISLFTHCFDVLTFVF